MKNELSRRRRRRQRRRQRRRLVRRDSRQNYGASSREARFIWSLRRVATAKDIYGPPDDGHYTRIRGILTRPRKVASSGSTERDRSRRKIALDHCGAASHVVSRGHLLSDRAVTLTRTFATMIHHYQSAVRYDARGVSHETRGGPGFPDFPINHGANRSRG